MSSLEATFSNLTPAECIQVMYPHEPDWTDVDSQTLITLVEDFVSEQSCATSAICNLSYRGHERVNELASWLLEQEHADEWLKAAALDVLRRNSTQTGEAGD